MFHNKEELIKQNIMPVKSTVIFEKEFETENGKIKVVLNDVSNWSGGGGGITYYIDYEISGPTRKSGRLKYRCGSYASNDNPENQIGKFDSVRYVPESNHYIATINGKERTF